MTLTITGENFSDDPLDNPVTVDGYYCYVLTSSPTEITCKVDEPLTASRGGINDELVIVYLAASEEATWQVDNSWTWTPPPAEILCQTSEFDSGINADFLTIVGLNLPLGDTNAISLYIDDVKQLTFNVWEETIRVEKDSGWSACPTEEYIP